MDRIKAILFDIDGTLYRQRPLRLRMAAELLKYFLVSPLAAARAIYILCVFRKKREALRSAKPLSSGLAVLQYRIAADGTGFSEERVKRTVMKWIRQMPLKHLYGFRYPGMEELLRQCRDKGIRIGAFSDYPAEEKIDALKLTPFFDLYLCSTDPGIDAFKPSPAGILKACRTWGLDPAQVAYIGDRPDIDGGSAASAGAHFFHLKNSSGLKTWISERI